MINVGIIGCGRISDLHAPGYESIDDARIYAVCDSNAELAMQRMDQWKAERHFTDYRELLADPTIDAVEILTPQNLHESMVIEAARAGKHIALQKPMTTHLKAADAMIEAVQENGVVFKVTDNYLFYPPIMYAKEMIDEGLIGTVTNLRIKLISGVSGGWEVAPETWQWRLKEAAEGRGMQTFDHGHHLWASAWYLLGDFEKVKAWIDYQDGVIDSPAAIMWKYRDQSAFGMCEYCHGSNLNIPSKYYANDEWIEITGSDGLIKIRRCTGNVCEGSPVTRFDGYNWHEYPEIESDWIEGFKGATRNFIEAIQGQQAPLLDGQQARNILRFALAIGVSAKQSREVYPDEFDAISPVLYMLRKKAEIVAGSAKIQDIMEKAGLGVKESMFAPLAAQLTFDLEPKFNPEAAKDWEALIGICLLPEKSVPETKIGIRISDGQAHFDAGVLPEDADLVIIASSGAWGAVLSKKKRIETAVIQGKIKIEGKAELALRLRDAFGL